MKRNLSYYKSMVIRIQACIRAESEPEFKRQMLLAVSGAKKRVRQIERRVGIGLLLGLGIMGCEPPAVVRTMDANVSAYCPCAKCCGKYSDGITANGYRIQPGDKFVAADKRFAFGTMLNIPGYGTVPVLDRGGAIKDNKLDVYFPTHQAALQWGRQYLTVKIERTKQ